MSNLLKNKDNKKLNILAEDYFYKNDTKASIRFWNFINEIKNFPVSLS